MSKNSNNNKTAAFGNTLLCEVAYEKCQLVAKKEQVYTADGKYMFSVSMTDRAKALLDNDGWEKGKESWLDYRQRTEAERELEKQKQYKLATDLADEELQKNSELQSQLSEKDREIEALQKVIEKKADYTSKVQEDLEEQFIRANNLESQLSEMAKALEGINAILDSVWNTQGITKRPLKDSEIKRIVNAQQVCFHALTKYRQ